MKRKMIAILLTTVMIVSPLGTVGTMAAEQTAVEEATADVGSEAETVVEEETEEAVETAETATEEQVEAIAEISGTCGENATWSLENGTLSIVGAGATYDYEYLGYSAGVNTPWYDYRDEIKEISIGEGITSLGSYLFTELENVKNVNLSKIITSIGDSAFKDCDGLETVELLEGLKNINGDAFMNCIGLQTLTIPESVVKIGYDAFSNCRNLKELRFCGNAPKNVYNCIDAGYTGTPGFPYVYYPSGNSTWTADVMETMGADATWIPYGDKTVEILRQPQDVEAKIGYWTRFEITATGEGLTYQWQYNEGGTDWYDMEGSQSSYLSLKTNEESYKRLYRCIVTDIHGTQMISNNAVLIEIPLETQGSCGETATWSLENGILYIKGEGNTDNYHEIFSYEWKINTPWYDSREKITAISIEEGITSLGSYLFTELENVETVNIPKTVTNIGDSVFRECRSLKTVDLPETIENIPNYAFSNCESLEECVISEAVTSIGSDAFYYCKNLRNIIIPEAVTSIGSEAFYGCQNLQTLTIPENVVEVRYNAFNSCQNLKELRFCGNAPENPQGCIATWDDNINTHVYYPADNSTWTADVIETMGPYAMWIPYGGDKAVEILRQPQDVEEKSGYIAQFKITVAGEELTYQWQYSKDDSSWYDIEGAQSKILRVRANEENYKKQYRCIVTDVHDTQVISDSANLKEKPLETQGSCGENATWLYEDGTLYIKGSGATSSYYDQYEWDDLLQEKIITVSTPWYGHHDKITEVVVETGITSLGQTLFACLENLKTVSLPTTVTWIGYYAFAYSNSLRELTIPEGVTGISYGAFYNCKNLEKVTFCGDVPSGDNCFENNKVIRAYYPSGNSTWTWDVMRTMGTNAMWIPYGDTTVEILVQPQDTESKAGRTAKFTVKAAGEGITYQWQYSDDNGANWKNSEMEGNQTNTVSVKVNEEDFGRRYRCVVKDNKNEAISDSAVLQKKILPTEGTCGENATWLYEDGTLYIKGSGVTYDYQYGYWDSLLGKYVQDINTPWYDYYDEVTKVVIDDEITYLGNYLFTDFEILKTVNIPNGVTHIGDYAFAHCLSLETLELPEGLEYIGHYAFDVWSENPDCNAFRDLLIPSTVTFIGDYAFRGCHFEEITVPESVAEFFNNDDIRRVTSHIFDSCKKLKKVYLPETLKTIPMCMFYGCSVLEECNLPDSVTEIGDYAFAYSGIKLEKLPQNLERITLFAFYNCPNIRTVTIPESVRNIDYNVFSKCENLETIIFMGNPPMYCHLEQLTNKGYYPAGNAEWTEERMQAIGSSMTWISYGDVNEILTITDQPEDIEAAVGDTVSFTVKATGKELSYQWQYSDDGFTWNASETDTDTLNVEVSEKDHGQMYRCIIKDGNGAEAVSDTAVLKVTGGSCGENAAWSYANGTLSIKGTGATYDYELDESMSIPVAKTPWYKYSNQITAVSIDNGITHLGSYLFAYLRNVKEISIPESVESLGACVFSESGLQETVLPSSVKTMAYGTFRNCSELTSVTLPAELKNVPDLAFEGCEKLTKVLIPEGVTSIGASAFMDCLSLETLELPEGLEAIYNGAFDVRSGVNIEGCKAFSNMVIPSTVTHIGYGAFRGCNFEEITIPESASTIEGAVFEHCTKLKKVILSETMEAIPEYIFNNCRSLEAVTIPESVTEIGSGAFTESGIRNIMLPQSLKSISEYAFYDCADLQTLIIPGDVTEIGYGAFMNCENLKNLKFYGNAPSEPLFCIGNNGHTLINTVYYPEGNATWTSEVMKTMGPDATWILHGNETEKLEITEQPKNIEAKAGETVSFSVKATGEGLTYQWQYSTSGRYWFNSGMEGNQTDTLTVEALTKRNGQMYRCLVTDIYGTTVTSEGGILTIVEKAVYEIVKQPEDVTVKEGTTAEFAVEVSQAEEAGYQWQYSNNGRYWFNSGMEGNQTAVLKVPAAAKRDGQQYRCVIKYADGATLTSDAAALTIDKNAEETYEIIKQPEDVTAKEGTTAEFTVEVSQAEEAGYQWQYSNNGRYWFNSGMEGNQTAVLKVPAAAKRDGQQYRCVIKYADGATLTSEAAVLIIDKNTVGGVEIVKQPENVTAAVGETAIFTVEASGEGLTYQWQYSTSGKYWFNSGMEGADTESLTVQATAKRNGQQYRCIITDANGATVTSDSAALTVVSSADIK